MLNLCGIKDLELVAKTFNNMKRLRFLKVYSSLHDEDNIRRLRACLNSDCGLNSIISSKTSYFHWHSYPGKSLPSNFCGNISVPTISLDSISSKITYFHWQSYTGKSLPSNFCGELLVELNLQESLVEILWEGVQDLANLRRLKLQACSELRELPDFSNACRLESVDLSSCNSLRYVHESLLCLHSLISLDVSKCCSLESLQSRIHLKSLKQVNANCCINLKEFSMSSEGLEDLHLDGCKSLTKLPDNMRHLSQLQLLSVPNCRALQSLPDLPPSLRILDAYRCTSLEKASISSTPGNSGGKFFSFMDCHKFDWGTIEEQTMRLLQNAVREKEGVTITYAGWNVPKWFGDNRTQHGSDTVQLSLSSHNLLGFVFCTAVISRLGDPNFVLYVTVEGGEMTHDVVFPSKLKVGTQKIVFRTSITGAGSVLLCSRPELSKWILEKIEHKRRNHGATTYNPKVFFKFHGQVLHYGKTIGESGVYPIYASECSDLNFHSRKRKAI